MLVVLNESAFIMKSWWIANIYWTVFITYFSYKLNTHDFATAALGNDVTGALVNFVMICFSVMVIEFQVAWYMYLKFKKNDKK